MSLVAVVAMYRRDMHSFMAFVAVIAGGARHALIRLGGILGLLGELLDGLLEGDPHGPGDLLFPLCEWGGAATSLSPSEGRERAH